MVGNKRAHNDPDFRGIQKIWRSNKLERKQNLGQGLFTPAGVNGRSTTKLRIYFYF